MDAYPSSTSSDKTDFATYQDRFLANSSGKLTTLFDRVFENKQGHSVLLSWMEPRAIELVSNKIAKEMDVIKTVLAWTVNSTTPKDLLAWDVDAFIGPLTQQSAPTFGHILQVAAETKHAKEHNKIKSCVTTWKVSIEWS